MGQSGDCAGAGGIDVRVHLSLDHTALETIILFPRKQHNAGIMISAKVLSPGSVAPPLDTKLGVNGHDYPVRAYTHPDRTALKVSFFHPQIL